MSNGTKEEWGKEATHISGGAQPQSDESNIPKRLDLLEIRARDVAQKFDKLENKIESFQHFMYYMVGAILVAFCIAFIFVALDYWKYNEERYEKFIDRTNDFYTKQEVGQDIADVKLNSERALQEFKNCLAAGKWNGCFK